MSSFLFFVESLAVSSGGPSRVAAALGSALARRGHTVCLASLEEDGKIVDVDSTVTVVRLAGKVNNPINWLRSAMRFKLLCKDYDVIVINGIWGPVDGLALSLAGFSSGRIYIRICGMLEDFIIQKGALKKMLARHLYVNRNLSNARGLIVNTVIEGDHVKELGFDTPLHVIPNGVELPQPYMTLQDAKDELGLNCVNDKILLYLGRLNKKKGLHILMPAFEKLIENNPSWTLLVAGKFDNDDFRREIVELVSLPGLQGKIKFVGEVSGRSKDACFMVADAFALPSFSEGFANSVVEAMSWGIPVLVTPGCNFPEINDWKCGVIVEPTIQAVGIGLETICGDENFRAEASTKSLELVSERYLLQGVVDKYEQLARY